MYDKPLTIDQHLTLLAATPFHIADLTKGLLLAQLLTPPERREWSARDVLAHLRACAELLAVLKPLPPEAWSRMATVTGAGKPRERTVQTYTQWLANHEQSHLSRRPQTARRVFERFA